MNRASRIIFSAVMICTAEAKLDANCFELTRTAGPDEGNTFSHSRDLQKSEFPYGMWIASIRGCVGSDNRVAGLTAKLVDEADAGN